MPFIARNLSQTGNHEKLNSRFFANRAPQIWTYSTNDALTVVRAAGYFNAAGNFLRAGDVIFVSVFSAATFETATPTVSAFQIMVVLSNNGTTVDVSDGTAVALTNT